MSRIPSDDARDIVHDRSFADQGVIQRRPNAASVGKGAHDIERLRRRQTDQPRDGAQALECRPGFIGLKAKRPVIATTRESVVSFSIAVRRDGTSSDIAFGDERK